VAKKGPRVAARRAVIELFVELLTVRIQLIDKQKEIPGDMIEAISSLVYAAQRITDLPELQVQYAYPDPNPDHDPDADLLYGHGGLFTASARIPRWSCWADFSPDGTLVVGSIPT